MAALKSWRKGNKLGLILLRVVKLAWRKQQIFLGAWWLRRRTRDLPSKGRLPVMTLPGYFCDYLWRVNYLGYNHHPSQLSLASLLGR